MKKIAFILLLSIGAGSTVQAQLLKTIKAKAKAAVDNSVDRSTNKLIDKAINNPVDNTTDTVLAKSQRKVESILKKKKNKDGTDTSQAAAPASDSTVIKPAGTDSSATVIPGPDSTVAKPGNQNLEAQLRTMQYSGFAANTCYENTCVAGNHLAVATAHVQLPGGRREHLSSKESLTAPATAKLYITVEG